jgi:hypothetical protein
MSQHFPKNNGNGDVWRQLMRPKLWKKLLWAAALLVGMPALGYMFVIFVALFQDRDMVYTSQIYRAKSDITAIETVIELYTKKHGHYPHEMADLVTPENEEPKEDLLLHMPLSPWRTPYELTIEHKADGDKLKLWTVPDQKTQERTKMIEFSNETDWNRVAPH